MTSLLQWVRAIVRLRRRYRAFGRGTFEPLAPENRRVLAFLRRWEDEVILCVNNLARHAQYVELDLREFDGWSPMELWSGQAFPTIGDASLPAHDERARLPLVPAAAAGRTGAAGRDRAGGRMTLPPVMDLLEQEMPARVGVAAPARRDARARRA